jgi:hypothetical protein
MPIATPRNAIINMFKASSEVTSIVPTTKITKGFGKTIRAIDLPRSIHVVQLSRGEDEEGDFSKTIKSVWATYNYHVVMAFELDADEGPEDAEDYESQYDELIRKIIGADFTIGGSVSNSGIGRSFFRMHPGKDGVYLVVVEVSVRVHEQVAVS